MTIRMMEEGGAAVLFLPNFYETGIWANGYSDASEASPINARNFRQGVLQVAATGFEGVASGGSLAVSVYASATPNFDDATPVLGYDGNEVAVSFLEADPYSTPAVVQIPFDRGAAVGQYLWVRAVVAGVPTDPYSPVEALFAAEILLGDAVRMPV